MKRITALLLLTAMFVAVLAGCGYDPEDTGSIIPLYLGAEQRNFDPTLTLYDKDTVKYLELINEGLTVVGEDGTISKGLAKNWYTKFDEKRGEYYLYIELYPSKWNDGRSLIADHIVYAWKRLLSPETKSPAAALLYDIKNAKAVKAGDMSIDSVGIASVDNLLIEIQFEKKIDVNLFLEAIASPSLVPIRDDVVVGANAATWATTLEELATNGQFTIKDMTQKTSCVIEKATAYRENDEEDVSPIKYVKPLRLLIDFTKPISKQIDMLKAGEIYYVGGLDKAAYTANASSAKTQAMLSVMTVFFNCTKPALAKEEARQALSTALDRNQIADIVGAPNKPATGFVTPGIFDSTMKTSFRSVGGDIISTNADVAKAKSLASSGGLKGTLTLACKIGEVNKAVADYCVSAWKELGVTVTVNAMTDKDYTAALYSGNFDMILLDYQGLSTSAYSFLAPFATRYSGEPVSVEDNSKGYTPSVTGFENAEYDAAIDAVLAATTRADRASLLHTAEGLFVKYMPAAPLVFYYDSYLVSSELTGLKNSAFGTRIFKDAVLKNYKDKNAAYLAKKDAKDKENTKSA